MLTEGEVLLPKILSEIRNAKAKRILIHLPAGFSNLAFEIQRTAPKKKQILFWSEGCYGACDIPHLQARALKCGLILSIGHSPMRHWNKLQVPVRFVEYSKGRPEDLRIPESVNAIPGKKIALVASNQFLHLIPEAKRQLRRAGKVPLVGKSGAMCSVDGQVTGCDFVSAARFRGRADAVLILGEGSFHSSGLVDAAGIPCYQLDPAEGLLKLISPEKSKKINFLYAKGRFGILVSSKPGQEHLGLALELKKKLEAIGKTAIILAGETFSSQIRNFSDIEVLITAACPRISDDSESYGLPILSAEQVLTALAENNRTN
ncbi:MAG: diphthamide synthesis protein [archaeon]